MNGHQPPLNALRAFEAAARQLSFKKAAEELHVTPAAISHQIKLIEETLGVTLFHRLTRAISLSSAGQTLLPKLSAGFAQIAAAVEQVRAHENDGTLTVNAPTSFAAKWLMPRLHRFVSNHPEIDIRIVASMRFVDAHPHDAALHLTDREAGPLDADIDIRFGNGSYPHCRVDLLFRVSVTPLCSPKLLEGIRPLRKPEDLRHHLLLHDDTQFGRDDRPDWVHWLKGVGADDVDPRRGLHFNHTMLGLEAAIDGLGVVLSTKELAARDLDAGRLVAPFDHSMLLPDSYYLVTAENAAVRPKISAFRNWLLEEARPLLK
jgi:LysR family glycine cleavage system transcriptional activator